MKKKAIIIGTGISGLAIAKMLKDNSFETEIYEQNLQIGGLIKCKKIQGNLFHLVGGHVFNSKNEKVLNWFWKHFDRDNEFIKAKRNAKVFIEKAYIGYPIENYLHALNPEISKKIILELLEINNSANVEFKNFKEFLVGNFGSTLYEFYFKPYNQKIWNTRLENIPLEWLEGKLPMPKISEILLSNIFKEDEDNMVHSTFYYPKINGSQFIVDRISQNLKINTSTQVQSISFNKDNSTIIVNKIHETNTVIYTGDIRNLHNIIQIDDKDLNQLLLSVRTLKSNGTSNMLCKTDKTDLSWLYLPDTKFLAHRIIYTGNFSEDNNSDKDVKTCVVEFSGKIDELTMLEEIKKLPGNLSPISCNYEPNSYVIQDYETNVKINMIKDSLSKYNIYLLGRFAEWRYYNMDICIENAMELEKIILKSINA